MGDIGDENSGWQVGGFTLPGTDIIAGAGGEAVGGALDAMQKFFAGIFDMFGNIQKVLTDPNGLLNLGAMAEAGNRGQSPGSFISGGIGSFMNLLLGPFTGAGGRGSTTPTAFNPNMGLSTNITLGGANTGRGGGFTGGVSGSGGGYTPTFEPRSLPGGGGALGASEVARAAYNAGFRGEALIKAVAIAQGESGWDPRAHNPVGPDNSYGLWQVNMIGNLGPDRRRRYGLTSNEQLFDPSVNARAAFDISGGGSNFRPWSVFTSGSYNQYMDEARAGAQAIGVGDMGTDYARYMPLMSSVGAGTAGNVVFHNTFRIDGGGGGGMAGGSIDMRRTVTQLADHLESEMKARAARSN